MAARTFNAVFYRLHKFFSIKTLKFKLILSYVFIVAFSAVAIGAGAYNKASGSLEYAAEQHASQSLIQISDSLDGFTREVNRISFALNGNQRLVDILNKHGSLSGLEGIKDYKEVQDIIYSTTEYYFDVTGCTIFALDGRNFSMNSKSVSLEYDFHKENWVDILEKRKNYFLPSHYQTYLLPANSKKVISLAKPLKDTEKRSTVGYLLIDYGIKFFEDIIQNKMVTQNSNIFIMDQDGQIVYSQGDKDYEAARGIAGSYVGHDKYDRVMTIKTFLDQEKIFLSYYKSSYNNWTVVQTVPLDEVYRNIKDIGFFTLKIIAAGLIFTIIVSLFLSSSIIQPINELQKNMKMVEQGNFRIPVLKDSTDEIAQLQNSFYRMAGKIDEMIEKNYKAELLRKEAELKAIQSQINPHFLCNTLSIIDSMAAIKGNTGVSKMCQALNKLFRYNIDFRKYATIRQEMEQIRLYLYIQAVRYKDRLVYAINLPEELEECKIMKLLIQPIVENVIIHVVEKKKGVYRLNIDVSKNDRGDIDLTIKNSGQGISAGKLLEIKNNLDKAGDLFAKPNGKNGYHIGLENVHCRIRQNYGNQYGLSVFSEPEAGTSVVISVPLMK